ncbi:unnamed protein product [Thelazia callipaeda]|uniref:Programmed cell death protein 5 n=1 Tax=Thelazia callipaeda TaxID=103827 RepID=A0A0N5CP30_THECL|nr:unnamed protein product [Thelazia callipaeda]
MADIQLDDPQKAIDVFGNFTEEKSDNSSRDQKKALAEEKKKAAEREDEMKNAILSQILDQDAMSRLSSLSAVKPEKAKMVENMIIQMRRNGQIAGKITDETLKQLLNRFSEHERQTTVVKFDRRRAAIDSDSD